MNAHPPSASRVNIDSVAVIDLGYADDDLSAERGAADQVNAALSTLGFFVVVGHGIGHELTNEVGTIGHRYFDRSSEIKRRTGADVDGIPRGFVPQGASALGRTQGKQVPADVKESFVMGPERQGAELKRLQDSRFFAPNRWPVDMPEMKPALTRFYESMEVLSAKMLRLFAIALNVDPDFFRASFNGHNSTLRLIHYPPLCTQPLSGQLRAGEHTDFGAFTILLSENATGGLQVRTRAGKWIDIVSPPHAFVINIGDLMMRWTNNRWLSNMHRVAIPSPAMATTERRQSIVYFANPCETAMIECISSCRDEHQEPLYEPIMAGEYRLRQNLRTAGITA